MRPYVAAFSALIEWLSAISMSFPGSEFAGRTIERRFRLLRWLGGTERSSVFLTEVAGDPSQKAAIKFLPADDAHGAQWARAKSLSHPHLVRLLDAGRCEIDGKELDFAVSEYAEEVLSEILAERQLTADEAQEMLPAVVQALEYLHAQGLVHGDVAPSNILAVGEHLKLSSDGIQAAGGRWRRIRTPNQYDAPEIATEKLSPAMDVWSLGVVLVEALTGNMPTGDQASGSEGEVPASVPEPFASIARECLRANPQRRCTLKEIETRLSPAAPTEPAAAQEAKPDMEPASNLPAAPAARPAAAGQKRPPSRAPLTIAILVVMVIAAVVAGVELSSHHQNPPPSAPAQNSIASPVAPSEGSQAAEMTGTAGSTIKGEVIHQVLPDVPAPAMRTIHGHFTTAIRVEVDPAGNVSGAAVQSQGPSRYFAGYALKAAQAWKFKPAEKDGRPVASTWKLQFEFGREGAVATPEQLRP